MLANQLDAEILSPDHVASATQENYGSGITPTIVSTFITLEGVDQSNLNDAIADEDYLEYSFTTAADINAMHLRTLVFTKSGAATNAISDNFGYDFSVAISDDGFATSQLISTVFTVDTNVNPSFTTPRLEADDNFYLLLPNTIYTFRVYFYGKTTDISVATWFDDFAVDANVCGLVADIDNDLSLIHI